MKLLFIAESAHYRDWIGKTYADLLIYYNNNFPEYILINRTFMNHESNVNSDKQYEFDYIDEVIVLDIIKKFI